MNCYKEKKHKTIAIKKKKKMEWKETFNNGILSIDGECERLGPLENYKNDAIEIDIKGVFKIISSKCFLNFVKLKEIKFPDTIETLEDNIIQGVKLIESLTLPKSLKTISTAQTFDWCYSIKNIFVSNENPYFCDVDGVLYSKDKKILYYVPGGRTSTSYFVLNSVETIKLAAFSHSKILQTIVIPPSVKTIEKSFGYGSEAINSVIILQCKEKVLFNTDGLFTKTNNANNLSLIYYNEICIEKPKITCHTNTMFLNHIQFTIMIIL